MRGEDEAEGGGEGKSASQIERDTKQERDVEDTLFCPPSTSFSALAALDVCKWRKKKAPVVITAAPENSSEACRCSARNNGTFSTPGTVCRGRGIHVQFSMLPRTCQTHLKIMLKKKKNEAGV